MEPSDRPWDEFRTLQGLEDGCYERPFSNSISVTKWTDEWLHLQKKCVDIEELMPFFWNVRGYASDTSRQGIHETIQDKKNGNITIPSRPEREEIVSFYHQCISNSRKVPGTLGELLRGELNREKHALFWLSEHPWVTTTSLVTPVLVNSQYVFIYCELLKDPKDWRWRDGRRIPKEAALEDIKTKVGSTLYIMSQGLDNLPVEAEIFLAGDGNLYRYTLKLHDNMLSIRFQLNAAASLYDTKMRTLSEATAMTVGEYWEDGQDKDIIKEGTFVFNLNGRNKHDNRIGIVAEIDTHRGRAKVKWNNSIIPSRKSISLKNLHPVPVKRPIHPGSQQEGDTAIICGGQKTELYGKYVVIEKVRSNVLHVRLGSSVFKILCHHLHVDEVRGEPIIKLSLIHI